LRLKKTAFPLPPHKPRGEGKAQREFWDFVRWNLLKGVKDKKRKATPRFCDSRSLAGAKVAIFARVAVNEEKPI
jgi:hypothetical protein